MKYITHFKSVEDALSAENLLAPQVSLVTTDGQEPKRLFFNDSPLDTKLMFKGSTLENLTLGKGGIQPQNNQIIYKTYDNSKIGIEQNNILFYQGMFEYDYENDTNAPHVVSEEFNGEYYIVTFDKDIKGVGANIDMETYEINNAYPSIISMSDEDIPFTKIIELYLPDSLEGIYTYSIVYSIYEDEESGNFGGLETLHIPTNISTLGSEGIIGNLCLQTIEYGGTVEQWNNIEKQEEWEEENDLRIIVCSDGVINLYGTATFYYETLPNEEISFRCTNSDYDDYEIQNNQKLDSTHGSFEIVGKLPLEVYEFKAYDSDGIHHNNLTKFVFPDNSFISDTYLLRKDYNYDTSEYIYYNNLSSLTLPQINLKSYHSGDYPLDGCPSLTDLNYIGTMDEWNERSHGEDTGYGYENRFNVTPNISTDIIHCSDGNLDLFNYYQVEYTTTDGQIINWDVNDEFKIVNNVVDDDKCVLTIRTYNDILKSKFISLYEEHHEEMRTKLVSLTYPEDTVMSTGSYMPDFTGFNNLETFTFPNNIYYYEDYWGEHYSIRNSMFSSCSSLTNIYNFPIGITTIENDAFRGCTNLTLTLPSNVTTIEGSETFKNVPLVILENENIEIPDHKWGAKEVIKGND